MSYRVGNGVFRLIAAGLVGASGLAPAIGCAETPPPHQAPLLADGSHDFDFEFGAWRAHISRRLHPLTGSTAWSEYDGTSVVRKVWNGSANLGELDVSGPAGRLQGLSLRLYNPQTRQWNISWSNAADGLLTPPMVGGFTGGRGEFYNGDTLNGRAIMARFIFSDIDKPAFRIEQAFSADGGQTWETNWIATFTRA